MAPSNMSRKRRLRRSMSSQVPTCGSIWEKSMIENPRSDEDGKNGRICTVLIVRRRKRLKT